MPSLSNAQAIESIIRSQLRALGYHSIQIEKEDIKNKSFDVIAEGALRNIFLRVLVRMVSEGFQELSPNEIIKIKQEAQSVMKEPWTAILSVNEKGELIDKIQWKNLSRQYA